MTLNADEVLDLCIERMRAGGDPEDILRDHPLVADEVRPLVALVPQLQALPHKQPTLEGMTRLVAKLLAERAPVRHKARWLSAAVLFRAAAIMLLVLGLGWGATAASSNTVPGDVFYPIKLLTERVKLALAITADDKVELRIVFSEQRLREALAKQAQGQGVDKALLVAMLDEAKAAVEHASDLSDAHRELMATRVAYLSEYQRRAIEKMKDGASADERETLAYYAQLCSDQCVTACRMIGTGEHTAATPEELLTCPMCRHPLGKEHDSD